MWSYVYIGPQGRPLKRTLFFVVFSKVCVFTGKPSGSIPISSGGPFWEKLRMPTGRGGLRLFPAFREQRLGGSAQALPLLLLLWRVCRSSFDALTLGRRVWARGDH